MGEIVNLWGYQARRYRRERGVEPAPRPASTRLDRRPRRGPNGQPVQSLKETTSDDYSQREPLLREVYGEVLRGLRLNRGERLIDVAGRAAISPQYLSEIERGRKDASSEILAAIARSLNVPVRELSAQVATRMSQANSHGPVCLAA
ncbi:helix-turn-helix transcriptional regulator [Paenarthrobacter sp. PH39-S1]|uniref:helix-turn-helix domain-containing protein n=1 Tax=Paenarthrobacter sp. PH39-S1 TaxID=3046204 RepID=UPI0024BB2D0F|nr:helix-turn-helix transcriptional regulator [Paenarthrobacter sp. PH39-S1]MDJ0356601.1 helix-turn-helix transcriptional regulator [Paenarthrobacter sp. PH39-S1]